MSYAAYANICYNIVDKAIGKAENIMTSLPRAEKDRKQDQREVNCSPDVALSSKGSQSSISSSSSGKNEKITVKVYRTRSRNNLLVAQYIDFKEPISDEKTRSLLEACISSSSSSSAFS